MSGVGAVYWGYYPALCNGGALRDAGCVHRACVCGPPLLSGFLCRGCVRGSSGTFYFPYLCVDEALAMMNYASKSILCKFCEGLYQSLEEGGVVVSCGGVDA